MNTSKHLTAWPFRNNKSYNQDLWTQWLLEKSQFQISYLASFYSDIVLSELFILFIIDLDFIKGLFFDKEDLLMDFITELFVSMQEVENISLLKNEFNKNWKYSKKIEIGIHFNSNLLFEKFNIMKYIYILINRYLHQQLEGKLFRCTMSYIETNKEYFEK